MSYFNFEVIPASDCLSYKQHYQFIELGGLGLFVIFKEFLNPDSCLF
jgi:hypothetical protein